MNYTLRNVKIKSSWFDLDGKFKKMKADGLQLYLSLFKFRLHNQSVEHYFLTSIKLLRQETGFTKNQILDLLKLQQKLDLIKIHNITRWDRFLDSEGKIPENHILQITATDVPDWNEVTKESGQTIQEPRTDDDFYISLEFALLELYTKKGLNYKCLPLLCLMKKLQNGNVEKKSYMTIKKMADHLGYDKDYANKLVHQMNRAYVLYSGYRKNGKDGHYFEHHLLQNVKEEEKFLRAFKSKIDKNISMWMDRKSPKDKESIPKVI